MKNIYMLEKINGGYRQVSQAEANKAIEGGKAQWVGSDGDPYNDTVTHYADRI